jgi:methylated-DNA-[protein]-cysteine S-methyltransferase
VNDVKMYAYDTPLGPGYLKASGGLVIAILLPGAPRHAGGETVRVPADGEVKEIAKRLEAYFRGEVAEPYPGLDCLLNAAGMGGFTRRVMEEVSCIPYGRTRTYGEIAAASGAPRAARAVGNAMAANPFPILVPCHRVIRASGGAGGFAGGPGLKAWLLGLERDASVLLS